MFCVAEISGARIENPHLLPFLSGMTGCKFYDWALMLAQSVLMYIVQWVTASFLASIHPWSQTHSVSMA